MRFPYHVHDSNHHVTHLRMLQLGWHTFNINLISACMRVVPLDSFTLHSYSFNQMHDHAWSMIEISSSQCQKACRDDQSHWLLLFLGRWVGANQSARKLAGAITIQWLNLVTSMMFSFFFYLSPCCRNETRSDPPVFERPPQTGFYGYLSLAWLALPNRKKST